MASRRKLRVKLEELFCQGPRGALTVLDIACGKGAATLVLLEVLASLQAPSHRISLDIDLDELNAGRTYTARHPDGERSWIAADLYSLPFSDRSADYIVANNIFHGVDRRRFGAEMYRVLQPAGRILLYDRIPRLLPVPRLAVILDREKLGALRNLPPRPIAPTAGTGPP